MKTIMDNQQRDDQNVNITNADRKNTMIELILEQKGAFFKSQQRDEEDMSIEQKRLIVEELLDCNQSLFLQRYGKYLNQDHLDYLKSSIPSEIDCEDISIQIRDLQRRLELKSKTIRNRRFKAMQELIEKGSYFSNSEMQARNPYLFEQMVGQYMNNNERKELQQSNYENNYNGANFSSFLMEQMRSIHLKFKYMVQENIEESIEEHDESDEEEENDDDVGECMFSAENKQRLSKEFQNQMMQDFLNGKDGDFFNYSNVDDNEDYDMGKEYERDQEEKYFEDY